MAATLSSVVWVIGLVVLVVAVALVAIVLRRRSASGTHTAAPAAATVVAPPPDVPMTDLEAALAKVTDRTGRPIRDHIDAETQHVDDLRVPDDTGPLLRRALDHVEQHHPEQSHPEQPGAEQSGTPDAATDRAARDAD